MSQSWPLFDGRRGPICAAVDGAVAVQRSARRVAVQWSSRGRREEQRIRCVLPYLLQHKGRNLPPFHLQVRTLLCIALAATLLAGCGGGGDPQSAAPSKRQAASALAGAPAPLARLHQQANQLLGGGRTAFEARLRDLRGHPVVVNKWASWCGPCRSEFPFFQRQSVKRGKEIAFVGVDGNDNDADARKFLSQFPVTYPSYRDPDLKVSASFKGLLAFPSTAFYDSKGQLAYLKQGAYATERKLAEDIERYAR